jgi:hypothetical protein
MTRLAKNILQNVVGRYMDRDREACRLWANWAGWPSGWPKRWAAKISGISAS